MVTNAHIAAGLYVEETHTSHARVLRDDMQQRYPCLSTTQNEDLAMSRESQSQSTIWDYVPDGNSGVEA